MGQGPTVADVAASVLEHFPAEWAEPWDRVGLALGDPSELVRGILVTLDPSPEAIRRAAADGRNLVVTHHPPFFEPPEPVAAAGSRGIAHLALSLGVSIISAHTNLDRAPAGGDALCAALGLEPSRPVETSRQPMTAVTVFVPAAHADVVTDAMALAGAGRIGLYEDCAFEVAGRGRFTPLPGSNPAVGTVDEPARAEELRVEMVCAPHLADRVVSAAAAAHPYDEPLVMTSDTAIARSAARLGRLCPLPSGSSLGRLARTLGERMGVAGRVWGDANASVTLAVTATGSGRSLISDAVRAGADVLVTGEVRYHDATDALDRGLMVIELGHDVTEWPLVPVLAGAVRATPGLTPAAVAVDEPQVRWWTADSPKES